MAPWILNSPLIFSVLTTVGTVVAVSIVCKFCRYCNNIKKKQILLMDPEAKYALPLIDKKIVNHDTRVFKFKLPSKEHVLGLPVGQHVRLYANVNGEEIRRAYTPVSSDDDYGYVDLVIKVYFKNVRPEFPEGGKLTQYLEKVKIGETVDFQGPVGRLVYHGRGNFSIKPNREAPYEDRSGIKKAVMIAGGSGIAPMLALIRAMIKDPKDDIKISLLFANISEDDILLRDELDEVAKNHPDRFKVWYTVDKSSPGWKYSTGYIDADMIADHMYPPSANTFVLMCGRKVMIQEALIPNLDKLGYEPKLRFIY